MRVHRHVAVNYSEVWLIVAAEMLLSKLTSDLTRNYGTYSERFVRLT